MVSQEPGGLKGAADDEGLGASCRGQVFEGSYVLKEGGKRMRAGGHTLEVRPE